MRRNFLLPFSEKLRARASWAERSQPCLHGGRRWSEVWGYCTGNENHHLAWVR